MIYRMCFLASLLVLTSCLPAENNPQQQEEPVQENPQQNIPEDPASPSDPQLTVSGLPGGTIDAYSTFILTVTSLSSGAIDFKSSRPDVATIVLCGRREYKVTAKSPDTQTPVTITFLQKADEQYAEAQKAVTFTVLPEPTTVDPTTPPDPHEDLEGVKVTYTEATDPVVNPERGHYRARDLFSSSSPLKASDVKAQRLSGYTLWYLGFYLTDFWHGDISSEFLDKIQESMDALREGGAKCVLRFAYRDYHSEKEEMDPEVDVVLRHVEQLKPLLQKNEDVIFVLQAGFVGAWGEWYYTSHFGFNPSSDQDYQPRRQLTDALLDALPVSRQIQLRTPQFKMRMYGLHLKDTITVSTAHDGSPLSRLGGHNDCFGASADDYGTFDNETGDRDFWKADTRYTIMGGETCGLSDYCTCEATLQDLQDYHWTYLNKDYNSDVLNRWKSSGCYNEIVARLGYRLVLQDLFYPEDFAAGNPCTVTFRFYNTGFAAPMNPREFILVWKTPSGERVETAFDIDPRTWQPGYHCVSATFTPSSDKGTLYLKLSDPLLSNRPEYSIAFANQDVFDKETGLNKLFELK